MKALHLKILLSHCFSTSFAFHKLQICSYIAKFWHIYVIGIKINKKDPRLFHPPLIIFQWIFGPLIYKDPPPFIRYLRVSTYFWDFWFKKVVLAVLEHVVSWLDANHMVSLFPWLDANHVVSLFPWLDANQVVSLIFSLLFWE